MAKQLVMAGYQIATKAYPAYFLRLSLTQKQLLQQNLRNIGKQLQQKLLELESETELETQQMLQKMLEILPMIIKHKQQSEDKPGTPDAEAQRIINQHLSNQMKVVSEGDLSNPERLYQIQQLLEEGINNILEKMSVEANRSLQQAGILTQKLPPNFLQVAVQAEEKGSAISGPPNMLNLLVETEKNQKGEKSTITEVTAIRMRRVEVELADSTLSAQRNLIRNLDGKINNIRQQYQQRQRELAVAEAEAAWRASWYED
ncbi:MAG: hypothetical protein GDA44_14070 [Prochloron sp. SP5CPC1]|nr:hypothetical protein [Candidatus Paraprochloron terpiosi SP5CPC1]